MRIILIKEIDDETCSAKNPRNVELAFEKNRRAQDLLLKIFRKEKTCSEKNADSAGLVSKKIAIAGNL